jgi:hypothetical protein
MSFVPMCLNSTSVLRSFDAFLNSELSASSTSSTFSRTRCGDDGGQQQVLSGKGGGGETNLVVFVFAVDRKKF